jgi:hypothetical protein
MAIVEANEKSQFIRADFVSLWKSYSTAVPCRVLAFWLDEKCLRAI